MKNTTAVQSTTGALILFTVINLFGLMLAPISATTVEEAVSERIKPIGSLCMAGDDCAAAQSASADPAGAKKTAEQIYRSNCVACHASGAAGAPIVAADSADSTAAWIARTDKGIDTLFANSIGGINAMPAMGLCMSCTDDDIKATVCHMLNTAIPADKITDAISSACAAIEQ